MSAAPATAAFERHLSEFKLAQRASDEKTRAILNTIGMALFEVHTSNDSDLRFQRKKYVRWGPGGVVYDRILRLASCVFDAAHGHEVD